MHGCCTGASCSGIMKLTKEQYSVQALKLKDDLCKAQKVTCFLIVNLCDSVTAGVSDVIYRHYKFNYLFAYLGGSSSVQVSPTDSMHSHSQAVHLSPYDLAPLPSVEAQVAKRKRRGTTSTVLTSSPYMTEVKVAAERKRKANSSVSKAHFKEAVSYTHLTLPTIYSV